jgi:Family of unknown function (DUF6535)
VTVPELKPNPQDTSAFYLENIYKNQLLSDSNVSRPSIAITPVTPPTFSPPKYIVWVNSLLFLSLTISLTCAMLVTMLQQWARRYLWITQRLHCSPHDGARMRAFFAHGVESLRFSSVAEAIPSLIHISLFLFFAGILTYLFNINHTAFGAVVWWIAASAVSYVVITIMPILRADSPYYSPLSSLVFRVYAVLLYLFSSKDSRDLARKYSVGFSRGIVKIAGEEATKSSTRIDSFILKWTFDAHTFASDDQLDQFFEYIQDFYNSNQIVQRSLAILGSSRKFSSALVAFLKRTLSSNLVSESVKIRRFLMCVKIADETQGTALMPLFSETARHSLMRTVEVGRSLRRPNRAGQIGLCAQTIVAGIIADEERRDDHWIELAADQLGKSNNNVRKYLVHGNDSVLLANWIHMARLILNSPGVNQSMASDAAECTLQPPSKFDIRNTLSELQHEFCSLWNEIVPKAKESGDGSIPHFIVFLLRSLYMDLHEGTDDASGGSFKKFRVSSYPSCDNPGHRSQGTPFSSSFTNSRPTDSSPPAYVFDMPETVIPLISPQSNITPLPSISTGNNIIPPPFREVTGPSTTPLISTSPLTGQAHSSTDSSAIETTLPPVHSQVSSRSDPSATTTVAIPRVDDDTRASSQLELTHYPQQPEPSLSAVVLRRASESST